MGMGKEQYKRITLKELIEKKEQRLAAKREKIQDEMYIESLGGTVVIEEPSASLIRDAVKMDEDGDRYMVYQCCIEPNLKSEELQSAYGVIEPPEIVDVIFKPGEVSHLAQQCMKMAGFSENSVQPVKDLKN